MQDLTLVGVHDDGEHLVLTGPDGHKYRLLVDDALRAAVRRDRARLGQLQIELDGRLRPRDIQARIRAGQTAEEVAESSGLPVEHIRRYEGPVLAEREFVVRQARAVRIRRPAGAGGTAPTLGDLVAERLAAREVPESETTWDAWRGEDGAWVVTLSFTAGTRQRLAKWTYDAQLRHVAALDDESRWLTEDDPRPADGGPARRLVPIREGGSADGSGRDRVYDVEADGAVRPSTGHPSTGHPSTGLPSEHPAAASGHPSTTRRPVDVTGRDSVSQPSATVDLLDSLRERRGRRQRALSADDTGPESFQSEPPAAHPPRSRPDLARDAEVLVLPDGLPQVSAEPAAVTVDHGPEPIEPHSDQPATSSPATPAAASAARRNKRASVPSWDDIVFGGRRE